MAVWQLPTWAECEQIGELDRSPLEDFIYHETPAGKDEAVFRDRLWKVIVDGKDRIDAFLAQSPTGTDDPDDCPNCGGIRGTHRSDCPTLKTGADHG
jgi:hypothetical protein